MGFKLFVFKEIEWRSKLLQSGQAMFEVRIFTKETDQRVSTVLAKKKQTPDVSLCWQAVPFSIWH